MGNVLAVCISEERGTQKKSVDVIQCVPGVGIPDDAHRGEWHRQVSLLANESANLMRAKGLEIGPGDFAENVLTEGIDLVNLPVGTRLQVGSAVILKVTQIGKECHHGCAIYQAAGECVMPTQGIFCTVIAEGSIRVGDSIEIAAPV